MVIQKWDDTEMRFVDGYTTLHKIAIEALKISVKYQPIYSNIENPVIKTTIIMEF